MNERIRELAEQATIHGNTAHYVDIPLWYLEKFAELIVGECMKLNHDHFNDEDPYSIDSLYRYHFGIE